MSETNERTKAEVDARCHALNTINTRFNEAMPHWKAWLKPWIGVMLAPTKGSCWHWLP